MVRVYVRVRATVTVRFMARFNVENWVTVLVSARDSVLLP